MSIQEQITDSKKYLDWRAWWIGLYSNSITAGATAITTLIGSNGIEATLTGVPELHDYVSGLGMPWKAAVAQFLIHMIGAAAKYIVDTKGLPTSKVAQ